MDTNSKTSGHSSLPNVLTWRFGNSMADMEKSRAIAHEFHAASHFSHIQFSEKQRDDLAWMGATHPDHFANILCEYGPSGGKPEIVGVSMIELSEYLFGEDVLIATVSVFFVSANLPPMLRGKAALGTWKATRAWAKNKGASEVLVAVTAAVKENDRFWSRVGCKHLGNNYSLPL